MLCMGWQKNLWRCRKKHLLTHNERVVTVETQTQSQMNIDNNPHDFKCLEAEEATRWAHEEAQ